MNIQRALEAKRDHLMKQPGVAGVGIGLRGGKPAVVVLVNIAPSDAAKNLPEKIGGYPVFVEGTGAIVAF